MSVPAHVATKVAALLDRPDSLPGRKDRQELLNLLARPDASGAAAVIKAASSPDPRTDRRPHRPGDYMFLAGEASLNRQDRNRLRQMATQWKLQADAGLAMDNPSPPSPDRGIDL